MSRFETPWCPFQWRILQDDPVDFGKVKRRRIRVLVERGIRIDSKHVRDLSIYLGRCAEVLHGEQRAMSVIVFNDLFSVFGVIGSWDLCPGGQWRNAVDAPELPRQWVITRGTDADMMLRLQQYLADQTRRRRSRDGGKVDNT